MTQNTNFLLGDFTNVPLHSIPNTNRQEIVYWSTSVVDYISNIDNRFVYEKKILGRTVKNILIETGQISNKAIIISLIKQLELCKEMNKIELLRSSLEIIVGITADDAV